MNTVAVVDIGIINIKNIIRALEYVGAKVVVATSYETTRSGGRIVLPGVGAFGPGIAELKSKGLDLALREVAISGNPVLGICLGMQLMLTCSEEGGEHAGLDLIPGRAVAIPSRDSSGLMVRKVPQVGWNALRCPQMTNTWGGSYLTNTNEGDCVYFVHSYMALPESPAHILAEADYRGVTINAAIRKDSLTGLQFHPERSGPDGLKILSEFVRT